MDRIPWAKMKSAGLLPEAGYGVIAIVNPDYSSNDCEGKSNIWQQ